MLPSYLKLAAATAIPVAVSIILHLIEKKTPFGKVNYWVRQVIYGILFGAIAVIGTEWGIPMNGAVVNCRDAAPLCAGLFFGGPAGILAGLIGGVERWIAVAWGVGSFTRVACSLSTIIAGVYAALMRRYLFEQRSAGWALALATGIVMEALHLSLVFLTNLNESIRAAQVVKVCTIPMLAANGLAVMLASIGIDIIDSNDGAHAVRRPRVSQLVQRRLLVCVVIAFTLTTVFSISVQSGISKSAADTLLSQSIDDVVLAVQDASDASLLSVTRKIAEHCREAVPEDLAALYGAEEINYVDGNGIIVASSDPANVGFDMGSGEQAAEFLCLLHGEESYVQEYGPITRDTSIYRKYAGFALDSGFVQVGLGADGFQEAVSAELTSAVRNRHISKNGYMIIVDINAQGVSRTHDSDTAYRISDLLAGEPGTIYTVGTGEKKVFVRYSNAEGYYVIGVIPYADAFESRNASAYVNIYMQILVFGSMFIMIYLLIKQQVVNRIHSINYGLNRIVAGDLDTPIEVRNSEEFSLLSDDINTTVDTMKGYIADAAARVDKELEMARNIQTSALPGIFPAYPNRKDFDIYASMNAAKTVGGDFYDFYLTDRNRFNVLIADVSGKGIPAALFMMRAKTQLKSLGESGVSVEEAFTRSNAALCEGNDADMFVTAWMGSIDLDTGLVEFANAGHNPPLVRHGDGRFEYLKSRAGFVLAGMDGLRYKKQTLQLERGDTLFLYTDGVTEATNIHNELYGEDRLLETLNHCKVPEPKTLIDAVHKDLAFFVGHAEQFDDITMLAFTFIGPEPEQSVRFDNAAISDVTEVTAFAEEALEKMGCPMKAQVSLNIAIDEIYSNIVKFAYGDSTGPITVSLRHSVDPEGVHLTFTDEGIPYNPVKKEDPDITLSAEEREIGGLGIFMVKKTMDEMSYEYKNEKNVLHLFKKF